MTKQFTIINTEPNCNILGLHPIIRGFFHKDLEILTGRFLKTFVYQVGEDEVMNAIVQKEDWFGFGDYLFVKIKEDKDFYNRVKKHLLDSGQNLHDYCIKTLADFKNVKL
ncbi:MAG: hypothetical protein WA057_00745, partial [Candidatus Magasanikiibacteriota bacterium]